MLNVTIGHYTDYRYTECRYTECCGALVSYSDNIDFEPSSITSNNLCDPWANPKKTFHGRNL